MKKFLKIALIVLALLVAVLILFPFIFKDKIMSIAKEEANNNLNARVEFADIHLSLIRNFPDVAAEIEDLCIVGKDTFARDTLANIKSFRASLDLMSVLSGDEIKVKQIIIDRPLVHVKVLENGKANYDIAKEGEQKVDTENKTDTVSDDAALKLQLENFEIRNGTMVYDDKQGDVFAELKDLNFTLSGNMADDVTNLNIDMQTGAATVASGGVKYLNKVKTKFVAGLSADLANSHYAFKENKLSLNEVDLGFDGTLKMPADDIDIDLSFKTKDTEFKDVLSLIPLIYKKDFAEIKTSGKFSIDGFVKGVYNEKNMPAYGLNLLINKARFQYPDLPKSVENINVNMTLDAKAGSGDNMTVDIKKATLTTAGNSFNMNAFVRMTAADTDFKGAVKGKIDLNSVKDIMPLEGTALSGLVEADLSFGGKLSDLEKEHYDKLDAKGNLGIHNMEVNMADMPKVKIHEAAMFLSPKFVDLKNFDVLVGQSDFKLNGKIDNIFSYVFKEELLSGVFNLNSNYIDADELAGTGAESENTAQNNSETSEEASSKEDAGPVEIPQNLDFVLHSDLKKIKYDKMLITNAQGKILLKDGTLDMNNLRMNMLGGEVQIKGAYDSKDLTKPKVDFDLAMSKISIAEALKTFTSVKKIAPVIESCIGNINANLTLSSLLKKDMSLIFETLMSSGSLSSDNISISGNGLMGKLANATKINKFKSPKVKDINLKYLIKNGNLTINPTTFKLAGMQVTFGGTQRLDKMLDLDLDMNIPQKLAGKFLSGVSGNNSDENMKIGAKIGGTSDKPLIKGLSSSLTDNLKDEVVEKVNDAKENVKEKANKIIEDAQKQADAIMQEAEQQAANIRSEAKKQGERLLNEAGKQGDKLIKQANNPITKKAAKLSKQELLKQAKKQVDNLNAQADKQANKVLNVAKTKSDKIINEARARAAKL